MVGRRTEEPLGLDPPSRGDAVGGGRGRCRPRRAARGRRGDDLHGVSGAPPDDPEPLQDRRRAHSVLHARRGAHRRHARAEHLRGSLRRDGRAPDGHGAALLRLRSGGARLRGHRTVGDLRVARAADALLRRIPHLPRGGEDRGAPRLDPACVARRGSRPGPPGPRPHPGATERPRHGPEPRRVLPGARGRQSLLRGVRRSRLGGDGALRRAHGAALSALRLSRASGGGAGDRDDGLGRPDGARDHRPAGRGGGARRAPGRAALSPVRRRGVRPRLARERTARRGARSDQGAGRPRRTALPRRRRVARAGGTRRGPGGRRSLRALGQGADARLRRGGLSGALERRASKATTSRWGSPTT